MIKVITFLICFILGSSYAVANDQKFSSWDQACAAAASVVEEGDLVFTDIPNIIFRNVAASTNSWTSHVGVVFRDPNGEWIVSESKVPISKEVPLCEFLKSSSKYLFEIKRLHLPLSESEIRRMRAKANSLLGRWYNFGFDLDSNRLFCSKFAYLVYQAIGVEVGQVQSFRELLSENPKHSLSFWRYWFFGKIPWERRTVTPASQLEDPKFISVLKGN